MCCQSKVSELAQAVEESIVDYFTLKPSNPLIGGIVIEGRIKTNNKDFIFVEVIEPEHRRYLLNHPQRNYDIFFHVNRLTFQLQHNALEMIVDHQLYHLFINSSKYDDRRRNFDMNYTPPIKDDYAFRFKI